MPSPTPGGWLETSCDDGPLRYGQKLDVGYGKVLDDSLAPHRYGGTPPDDMPVLTKYEFPKPKDGRVPMVVYDPTVEGADGLDQFVARAALQGQAEGHDYIMVATTSRQHMPWASRMVGAVKENGDRADLYFLVNAVVIKPDKAVKTHTEDITSVNASTADPTAYSIKMVSPPKDTLYHGTPVDSRIRNLEADYLAYRGESDCKAVFLTDGEDIAKLYTQQRDAGNFADSNVEWEIEWEPWVAAQDIPEDEWQDYGLPSDALTPRPRPDGKTPGGSILDVELDWGKTDNIPIITYSDTMHNTSFDDVTSSACELAIREGYPAAWLDFEGALEGKPELMIFDTDAVGVKVVGQRRWAKDDFGFKTQVRGASRDQQYKQELSKRQATKGAPPAVGKKEPSTAPAKLVLPIKAKPPSPAITEKGKKKPAAKKPAATTGKATKPRRTSSKAKTGGTPPKVNITVQ